MTGIAGKRVLIIGGSSGVGLASAQSLSALGAVVIIVSRSAESVERAVAQLDSNASGRTLDIQDDDTVVDFGRTAGTFDHVVVSAAKTPIGRLDALTLSDAYAAMDSKFWGAYRVARSVSIAPDGSLTFVSGYLSARPGRAAALQSAINSAIEGLGRALALELAPIRVNTVSPGTLQTPPWDGMQATERKLLFESVASRTGRYRAGHCSGHSLCGWERICYRVNGSRRRRFVRRGLVHARAERVCPRGRGSFWW